MIKKYLLGSLVFCLAFVILSVSVMRSTAVTYVFATPMPTDSLKAETPNIDYQVPYPGRVSPDKFLWTFKAARDRIWYLITTDPLKKAELALLFSDKRLMSSKELFENKKPDLAFSTLTKGEKYLEIAVKQERIADSQGVDTTEFLKNLATASLKHRQVIEEIMPLAPEDAKPGIVRVADYSKEAYKFARDALNSKGVIPPNNPFDRD